MLACGIYLQFLDLSNNLMFNLFSRRPKIKINYNRFLDPIFTFYCQNNPELKNRGWNDWKVPTPEELDKRIQGYKTEWQKTERTLIDALYKITSLRFKRNIIDVHIVSGNPRQFSRPIVIKSGFKPEEFVDNLLHELIHVLFSDNKKDPYPKALNDLFPNENQSVKNHVVLHAILKHMYINILKDENRLKRNLEVSKNHSMNDYSRAWEIVDTVGYEKILEMFVKQ